MPVKPVCLNKAKEYTLAELEKMRPDARLTMKVRTGTINIPKGSLMPMNGRMITVKEDMEIPIAYSIPQVPVSTIRAYNKFAEQAKDYYAYNALPNPYIAEDLWAPANKVFAEEDFIPLFMKESGEIISMPEKETRLAAEEIVRDMNNQFKFATKLIHSKLGKQYLEGTKYLADLKSKLNDMEDAIAKNDAARLELRKLFYQAKEEAEKIELAEKHNALADECNELTNEYNRLIKQVFARKVNEQLSIADKMVRKDLKGCKSAFTDLFGPLPKRAKDKDGSYIK